MSKRVLMLLYDIDVNKGGITSVMLSRSKELSEHYGYDVDLISLDYKKDYINVRNSLRKSGRLSENVDVINVHDYYKKKNTNGKVSRTQLKFFNKASDLYEKEYTVQDSELKSKQYARYFKDGLYIKYKKWTKKGVLSHIDYFNETRNRIYREEFHKDGYILRKIYFDLQNNEPKQELYYTEDGFCYLNKWLNPKNGSPQNIFLFNRLTNKAIVFKNNKDFHVYWLNEFCREQKEKPFLICDGVGSASKVLSMEPEAAYRIYSIHTNHFDYPHEYGSPIKSDHVTLLNNLEKKEAVVVLSNSQKSDIVSEFGDYNNVFVIPNFITPLKEIKIEREPNLVTMIARYHPEKGIDEAILAFKEVIKAIPNAILEIYGHGEDEDRLKSIIRENDLIDNVIVKGYTTKVSEVLGRTKLTILTSQFEGLNVVSLEAMACKVPVVSYDVNYGMRDIIQNGVNGYLVPRNDKKELAAKIVELLSNPDKVAQMGEEARKYVLERFSKEKVCSLWIALFKKLSESNQP
ncbi:glycosyltransferase [Robertmurraya massiliosenegalensis]|uniref:glycosyltransferase n=1 Tax=Robertmurraya TaxID=2837507 RepID=UPI0039A6EAF9